MSRTNIRNYKRQVNRPVDWQIVIENVPANSPIIGLNHEYWGFSIYRGPGDDRSLGVGSADDVETCIGMALEMLEICQKQARERKALKSEPVAAQRGEK